ncbi:MAG: SpaA isopeptide-forming pilin-related protein, partial [Anaerolineae bacterium]|nr:SpaA isopeptide-forming pilin-related protein [Anaerolineae bacterium]
VGPVLTFRATVNTGAPAVIKDTGLLAEASGAFNVLPSNTTQTATSGSIGDYAWADADGDGIQDTGEVGLAGVKVYIDSNSNGRWDAGEPYDITDAGGLYRIYGLAAGTYSVRTDPATYPAGYLPTTPPALSVTLTAGQQYNTADFGLASPRTASIGDTVWLDANNNGVLDVGEAGLPGITVTLEINIGGTWYPVTTTTTDAGGKYFFSGLRAGNYRVTVNPTGPVTSPYGPITTLAAATTPTYDRDGIATPHVALVTLATDTTVVSDADFGYNWSGSIGDYVWYDNDFDGVQDAGEPPIEGAFVMLYFDANGNGIIDQINGDYQVGGKLTNASGQYLFQNLPPGKYLVDVYEDSITTDGVRDLVPTTPDVVPVTLGAGAAVLTADFGYYEGARVEGNVFWDEDRNGLLDPREQTAPYLLPNVAVTIRCAGTDGILGTGDDFIRTGDTDANGNGSQDVGEPGIAGVTVLLYRDVNNNNLLDAGDVFLAANVTDANGKYLFAGLADGNYVVAVNAATLPADFAQTYDNSAPLDGVGQADIVGGNTVNTVDFGYRYSPPGGASLYTISGRVYNDLNNSGNDEGEPGFSGVDVTVVCNYGTFVVQTNASGNWSLAGVPQGSTCTVLDADETDLPRRDYAATETPTTPIVVNNDIGGLDFGYNQRPGSISGTVCQGNGNGLCQPGEAGFNGVTVVLTWFGPDNVLGTADDQVFTTTTNLQGDYTFTNLEPGRYQVVEINPPGYTSIADADGGNPDNISPLILPLGGTVADRDFEDVPPPTATVTKTLTTPASGPANVGDTITFTLRVTNTGTTALTSLAISDTYDASVLTPVGFSLTPDGQAAGIITWTNSLSPSLPLAVGQSLSLLVAFRADAPTAPGTTANTIAVTGRDAFGQPLGPLSAQAVVQVRILAEGQIGDRVWWDINGNGSQDAGEPGIPGVDLLLNGGSQSATTGAAGDYLFAALAAGTYTVTINPTEFQPGGTLYNWAATYPVGLAHTFTITATQVVTTADFGLNIPSSYAVTKRLAMADPTRPGEPITFTIRVTNTGATWLAALPMQDMYNNTFMTYGFGGDFARPDSDDHVNDGLITWTDALSVTRGGPGLLAPGASMVIT